MSNWRKIMVMAFFATSIVASSQPYKTSTKESDRNFNSLQKQFLDWAKDKDLNKTKGWKYYKRWEYDMQSRVPLSGKLPDPNIYFDVASKIASKKIKQNKSGNTWVPVGPLNSPAELNRGVGRINCITFHPSDSSIFWVGVAQGGVWKTTDGGDSWLPLTDDLPIIRVSDIALDPNDPDVMYIAMGDYAYVGVGLDLDDRKRNTHYGIGIYKSTNGGNTWAPTGFNYSQTQFDNTLIRRVFVNPANSNNVIAAGVEGIFQSLDGGNTWSTVDNHIIWDIEQHPTNASILYASTGPISNLGIGAGSSGIMKSTDFGATWTALTTGIPTNGDAQRIELSISSSDPDYVYAVCANSTDRGFHGVYRTTDGGTTWSNRSIHTSSPNILGWNGGATGGQGTYDLTILVEPSNPNTIYVGGIWLWMSIDGGETWTQVDPWSGGGRFHADQHYLAHNPLNNKYYMCNDGGLYFTDLIDYTSTFTHLNDSRMTSSFYKLGVSQADENTIIAGAQDNSTFFKGGSAASWINIIGGDGMDCIAHPTNPDKLYGSWQYGNLCRSFDGGVTVEYDIGPSGDQGEWVTPYMLAPNDPFTIYGAYGDLYESINEGDVWDKISNFPEVPSYGYPSPASAMDISIADADYIYVAKRGLHSYNYPSEMWVTKDRGGTWTDITTGLPDYLYFTDVEVSNANSNVAWVTCGGFEDGVKIFKTTNSGQTWANVSFNLPNIPVNNIEHERGSQHNTVYIATDVGVYYLSDLEDKWILYSDGLPNVIASDIELHYNTNSIYIATFGRGIWSTDFATPVNVGIDEGRFVNGDLSVVPNPNTGTFDIRFANGKVISDKTEISVIDVMGKIVHFEEISFATDFNKELALELKSGVYYVKVRNGDKSTTSKFIVK